MGRLPGIPLLIALLVWGVSLPAHAGVRYYTGEMTVLATSGKSCDGQKGARAVALVLDDDEPSVLKGYFEGAGISGGHFSGNDAGHLEVYYPYSDAERAGGHSLSITVSGGRLAVELRDRHLEATVDDCNFDLARMSLALAGDGEPARRQLKRMEALFEAQSIRSRASAAARAGNHVSALALYEDAYGLAARHLPAGAPRLNSFITGLANTYIRLGKNDDFDRLYGERIATVTDAGVRAILNGHRLRTLLAAGKALLAREDYPAAIDRFLQAYRLQPQSKDAVSAVMSAYLRSQRHDEAIAFLERAEKIMERERDRTEVREARALALFRKSRHDERGGRAAQAESSLRLAMQLDPGVVQYPVALARLRHKLGEYGEAEGLLDDAFERFTDATSRREISEAREKMKITELILKRLKTAGS